MSKKKLLIYFGAGGCGDAYCRNSGVAPDFFVDNDASKWGTFVNGAEVLPPDFLSSATLKKVVITTSFLKEVYPQIVSLGVDEGTITVPSKSMLSYSVFHEEVVRIQSARKLHELMVAMGDDMPLVSVGGTALGFVRGNDFILWDDDIDLFAPVQTKSALISLLDHQGVIVEQKLDSVMKSIVFSMPLECEVDISVSVDFFDGESVIFRDYFEDYTWDWRTEMFIRCAKVEVHDCFMNVPNPPEQYLSKVYGQSWKQPNPDFGYFDYAGKKM